MKIEICSYGSIRIDGREYRKDLKIVGGRVRTGWWRQEGHVLKTEDVKDLLEASPQVLVIGTGTQGQMRISQETRKTLDESRIISRIGRTCRAVDIFNRLSSEGKDVAAAFHLTC
ncbi:MAG: MTH938/NDUFAF3 family protein [Candidatus Omnitrophota bacterium]